MSFRAYLSIYGRFPVPAAATLAVLLASAPASGASINSAPGTAAPTSRASSTVYSSLFHSADSNQDGQISSDEIARVIDLYNTRNGTMRTGCYTTASGTVDGFAPDPSRSATATVTLAHYHSADSNHDGQISLPELSRAIELYSYQTGATRTGYYHVQPGTEDGFAPGLNYQGVVAGASVPRVASGVGDFYLVSTAGTSQSTNWAPGDAAVWNGTTWQRLPAGSPAIAGPALQTLANVPSLIPAKLSNLQNASRKVFRVFYGGTSIENMAWSWGYHLRDSLIRQYGDSGNHTLYTQAFGGTPGQNLGWFKQRYGGLTFYRLRGNANYVQGQGSTTPIAPLVFSGNVREIIVHYSTEPDGGTMSVLIDGAAPTTGAAINCNGAQSYNNKLVYSFPVDGQHTISISCPTDASKFGYFETIDMNLNNPGIAFVDGSLGGSSITQMCNPQPTGATLWQGTWKAGTSYNVSQYVSDPVDGHCYQARTNVSSSTPPRSDSSNWVQTGEDPPSPQANPLLGVESYMLDNDPLDRFDLVLFAWVVNDAGNGPANFSTYYIPALADIVAKTKSNGQQLMVVAEMGGAYLANTAGGPDPVYSSIVSLLAGYAAQPNVTFLDWNSATQPPTSTLLSDWQTYADHYYNSHALLRGAAAAGSTTLVIDDASSLVPGAAITLDTGVNQEAVTVAGNYLNILNPAGWSIPLASPTTKPHASGASLAWSAAPLTLTAVTPALAFSGNFIHPAPAGHAIAYALACAALNVPSDGQVGDSINDGSARLLASNPALQSVAAPPESPGQPSNISLPTVVDNTGMPDASLHSIGQANYVAVDATGAAPAQLALWFSNTEQNLAPYFNATIQQSSTSDDFGRYIDVTNTGFTTAPFANLNGKLVTWTLIIGPGAYYWDVSDGDTNTHQLHAYIQGNDVGPTSYHGTNTTGRPIVVFCTTKWEGSSSRISFRGLPHLYGLYATATNYPCVTATGFDSWSIGAPTWINGTDPVITQAQTGQTYYENAYDRDGTAIVLAKACRGGRVRKPNGSLYALFEIKNPAYVYPVLLGSSALATGYDAIMGGSDQTTSGAAIARGPQWPAWVAGANYSRGTTVTSGSAAYTAKTTIVADTTNPGSDATNWVVEPNNGILAVAGSKWTILTRIKGSDSRLRVTHVAWIPTSGGSGTKYWNDSSQTWDSAESPNTAYSYDMAREENFAVTVTMGSGMGVGQFEVRVDFAAAFSAMTLVPGSSAGM